jgi:hypothetical protein
MKTTSLIVINPRWKAGFSHTKYWRDFLDGIKLFIQTIELLKQI